MSDEDSVANPPIKQVNKPADTAVNQQRMKSWNPILDPLWVIFSYIVLGVIFVPVGTEVINFESDVNLYQIAFVM